MFKVLIFSLIIFLNLVVCFGHSIDLKMLVSSGASIEDTTELLLTFLIHRHGDRTPIESTIRFSTDVTLVTELSAKYGYGHLTEKGINRGYQLGKFIRQRYDEILSPSYNGSEIYVRSTDSTRAKMTVLAALAAVYPARKDNWSHLVNWTPVPYSTIPAKYDFNLAISNCPNLLAMYYNALKTCSPEMEKYTKLLNLWSKYIDYNITATPLLAYPICDVYAAQISLGVPLTKKLKAIYPKIRKAAGAALNASFGTDSEVPLMAGPLLNEFFKVADQVVAGKHVQKVQWYSAHDVNVFSLMAASNITPRLGLPKYGSMFALELRKTIFGKYIVVPIYLEDPSVHRLTYPRIGGCDRYCDLETFRSITSANVLDEDTWRTKCGFTKELVVDESSLA